jgi:hypothetical protein
MAEFWDTHSLTNSWGQTEPAAFEVTPEARRRYLVAVGREGLARVQQLARTRGVRSESLVNLLLKNACRRLRARLQRHNQEECAMTVWISLRRVLSSLVAIRVAILSQYLTTL